MSEPAIGDTAAALPVIGLAMDEAIELIEILEDLAVWLHDAPAEVKASWYAHTGGAYRWSRLRADLLGWAQLLSTRQPRP